MPKKGYDFAGYVTRNNVRCTDGTIIRPGCFSDMDGKTVPLVYQHNHRQIDQLLGHTELEMHDDGLYAYAYCNDGPGGEMAREAVRHGDVNAFSIWAKNIKHTGSNILHGDIKEISLVLAGADRTALIDTIGDDLSHDDSDDYTEAEIQFLGGYAEMTMGDSITHADDDKKEEKPVAKENEAATEGSEQTSSGKTIQQVLDTFDKDQEIALNYMVGLAYQEGQKKGSGADDSDEDEDESEEDEEETEVKHNAFEDYGNNAAFGGSGEFLSHDQFTQLVKDAKRGNGSLRDAYNDEIENGTLEHADSETNGVAGTDYGIADVDYLFPDARTITAQPDFISRNMDWVAGVLSGVHRTPFSRVKSIHADITADEARARGYIKGHLKKEEVFTLLKRVTEPQTVYKKQKMDKQDIDDITGFDVMVWLKNEMQVMLREEVARAILIGDGRSTDADDKIHELNIRPVYNDADLYTIKYPVEIAADATDADKAKALLQAQLKARKLYKGSGNPVFYTTEDNLTDVLLLENGIGERMYKTEGEVATAMRVSRVQTVEPMEGLQIEIADSTGNTKTKYDVAGIDVNLSDYNVGTNGGAKTDFFSQFNLDYNQQICLYETRLSGAMIKPYGAITFYFKPKAASTTTG